MWMDLRGLLSEFGIVKKKRQTPKNFELSLRGNRPLGYFYLLNCCVSFLCSFHVTINVETHIFRKHVSIFVF